MSLVYLLGISVLFCGNGNPQAAAQELTGVAAFENSDSPLVPVIKDADKPGESVLSGAAETKAAAEIFENERPLTVDEEIPTDLLRMGITTTSAAAEVDALMEEHTMLQTFKKTELLVDEGISETLQEAEIDEARPEDIAALKRAHFEQKQEMISLHKSEVQKLIQEQKVELGTLVEELKSDRAAESSPEKEIKTEARPESAEKKEEIALLRDEIRAIVRTSIDNIGILENSYMIQWKDALDQRKRAFQDAKESHEAEIQAADEKEDPKEKRAAIKIANDSFHKIITDVRHDFRQAALAFQHEFKEAAKDIGETSRKRIKDRRELIRKKRLMNEAEPA